MIVETVASFAAIGFTLNVAHDLADHVFGQTDHQAANKAKSGWQGWNAILMHVIDYHIVQIILLAAVILLLGLSVSALGLILGIAFSMATHAFLDRRWPVRWILENTGSPEFAKMQTPVNGMYESDQALHKFALWISTLLIVLL